MVLEMILQRDFTQTAIGNGPNLSISSYKCSNLVSEEQCSLTVVNLTSCVTVLQGYGYVMANERQLDHQVSYQVMAACEGR